MNARIINLRSARKRKARAAAKAEADDNAYRHGRTKEQRQLTEAENSRIERLHQGHRREDGPGGARDGGYPDAPDAVDDG